MSKYWTIVLPCALCGVGYYGYHSGGYLGNAIQGVIDPLLELGRALANALFGA